MQRKYELVNLISLPKSREKILGYQSDRRNRLFILYFDPITTEYSVETNNSHNAFDSLLEAQEQAISDIQKFKLNRMIKRLEITHQNRIYRNNDWGNLDSLSDYNNSWRIADYGCDTGANEGAVKMIIDHPRVQNVLDSYYGLGKNCFSTLFFSGQAILMFDRHTSELHIGGEDLFDLIESNDSSIAKCNNYDQLSNELITQQLNEALMYNTINHRLHIPVDRKTGAMVDSLTRAGFGT